MILTQVFSWIAWLFAGLFLFFLPGAGLFTLLYKGWDKFRWPDLLGIGIGLGLALYPLIFLWFRVFGINSGVWLSWLVPIMGGILFFYNTRNKLKELITQSPNKSESRWAELALLSLLVTSALVRFYTIRDIQIPMWGDSYQHSMISQLMIDNKGLFSSWQPYVPYTSLTIHWGFSSYVTVFSWLTGIPAEQATLIMGQILNCFAVITLIPLTMKVTRNNPWSAPIVVLVAGLLSPMPAFYVNWGRYAQLAGQAILPIAIWLTWTLLEGPKPKLNPTKYFPTIPEIFKSIPMGLITLASISVVGMTLGYYRMPFYFVAFFSVWALTWAIPIWGINPGTWLVIAMKIILLGGIGLIIFLPWLINLRGATLASAIEAGLSGVTSLDQIKLDFLVWREYTLYLPLPLLFFVLTSLVWSWYRKYWFVSGLFLWMIILVGYYTGQLIHLPGANMLQNFMIAISLYIPVSLIIAWFLGDIIHTVIDRLKLLQSSRAITPALVIVTLLLVFTGIWGFSRQKNIAQPENYALVRSQDLAAMDWIMKNTPDNATFLIEGFRIYGGASAAGADAGWWIPLLARRGNTIPPQYAMLNETSDPINYTQKVVDRIEFLENNSPSSPQGIEMLCSDDISYVYIGQVHGEIGSNATQLFNPADFSGNNAFDQVYQDDQVHIFRFDRSICG